MVSPTWDHALSQQKIDRLCGAITGADGATKAWQDVEELIGRINRKLRGWSNYFRIGTVEQGLPEHRQPQLAIGSDSGCARSSRSKPDTGTQLV